MKATNKTKRLMLSLCCLTVLTAATAQVQTSTLEYWLDTRFDERQTVPLTGALEQTIDVSRLCEGIHTVEMRVSDTNGRWSTPLLRHFLKSGNQLAGNALTSYEYCIDGNWNEARTGVLTNGQAVIDIDITALCKGVHTLEARVKDQRRQCSQTLLRHFLALGITDSPARLTSYRYWIDDFANAVEGQTADGNIMLDLDISKLSKGVHTLAYQVADSKGRLSSPQLHYFLKPDLSDSLTQIVAYEYWFNHGPRLRVELSPADSINAKDWVIEVCDVVPDRIPSDYLFDLESETVSFRDDVFVGLQVFNAAGRGSQAVISDTVNIPVTVRPQLQLLAHGDSLVFAAPSAGRMMGWKTACLAGDSLTYVLSATNVTPNFIDADGQRLAFSRTVDDAGNAVLGVKPRGKVCYALLCGTMPDSMSIALTVTNAMAGDVNGDRRLTVTDVVDCINYLLGAPHESFNETIADVNADGKITMGDAVLIIDLVMKADLDDVEAASSRRLHSSAACDRLYTQSFLFDGNSSMPVMLSNERDFTAFQMDVRLPEGVSLGLLSPGSRMTDSHVLTSRMVSDRVVRILGWSTDSRPLMGHDGLLLSIGITGSQSPAPVSVNISNIFFATPDGRECQLPDIVAESQTTGLIPTPMRKGATVAYDLQGRMTGKDREGLLIVMPGKQTSQGQSGKKTIIKQSRQ